jgi:hypothetical protein
VPDFDIPDNTRTCANIYIVFNYWYFFTLISAPNGDTLTNNTSLANPDIIVNYKADTTIGKFTGFTNLAR